jgi:hypothetical protein
MERFLATMERKINKWRSWGHGTDLEKGSAIATLLFAIRGLWNCRLERNHAVNAICPENAEFALVVSTKVDETAPTLAGAG